MTTTRSDHELSEALACLDLVEEFKAECVAAGVLAWFDLATAEADALRSEIAEPKKGD